MLTVQAAGRENAQGNVFFKNTFLLLAAFQGQVKIIRKDFLFHHLNFCILKIPSRQDRRRLESVEAETRLGSHENGLEVEPENIVGLAVLLLPFYCLADSETGCVFISVVQKASVKTPTKNLGP